MFLESIINKLKIMWLSKDQEPVNLDLFKRSSHIYSWMMMIIIISASSYTTYIESNENIIDIVQDDFKTEGIVLASYDKSEFLLKCSNFYGESIIDTDLELDHVLKLDHVNPQKVYISYVLYNGRDLLAFSQGISYSTAGVYCWIVNCPHDQQGLGKCCLTNFSGQSRHFWHPDETRVRGGEVGRPGITFLIKESKSVGQLISIFVSLFLAGSGIMSFIVSKTLTKHQSDNKEMENFGVETS
jgi:hypothetical protein